MSCFSVYTGEESLLESHYTSAWCTGECVWVANFEVLGSFCFFPPFLKRCFRLLALSVSWKLFFRAVHAHSSVDLEGSTVSSNDYVLDL